jgi:hypothetical protein|tara:strand:- start:535 stop:735 length:201 start_codon:yes stop_codon:yes gene_type:complete
MLVEIADLAMLGIGLVCAFLVWEQQKILNNIAAIKEVLYDVVDKHNDLSDAFVELVDDLEYEEDKK